MKSSRRKLSLPFRRSSKPAVTGTSISAPSANTTLPTTAFLLLPSEIRNVIYNLLFLHSTSSYYATKPLLSPSSFYRRHIIPSATSASPHAICLVCHQTYTESYTLFYSLTVFDLSTIPDIYHSIPSLLASPPRPLAALAAHLHGVPLQSLLATGLFAFAALRTVALTLPQRVIMHTMASPSSSGIAALEDAEIYELLKDQEDWAVKHKKALRLVLEDYPDVNFRCLMDVVCHENRRYGSDPGYDSFRLPCEYDPYYDKLIAFKDQITKLSKN